MDFWDWKVKSLLDLGDEVYIKIKSRVDGIDEALADVDNFIKKGGAIEVGYTLLNHPLIAKRQYRNVV